MSMPMRLNLVVETENFFLPRRKFSLSPRLMIGFVSLPNFLCALSLIYPLHLPELRKTVFYIQTHRGGGASFETFFVNVP